MTSTLVVKEEREEGRLQMLLHRFVGELQSSVARHPSYVFLNSNI
jgi:hypothetical protein